ncbi:MAG TPA: hypothetical protein VHG28_02975, partial [Longimicrobiaceae bacterium]|nr:hypothetical protein [Longimicrobiaceae bacterium]
LCGGASALRAQTIPSPIRYIETRQWAGAFAGYLFSNPSVGINETDIELGPRSAPLVGLQYGFRFAGPLAGEARVGFGPTERKVYAPGTATGSDPAVPQEVGTADVALLMGEAGLVFSLTGQRTWHGIAPFLVGTGGLVADLNRGSDADEEVTAAARYDFGPAFAVGFGIGTDWFPTERLSVRLEGRDRLWKIEVPPGLRPSSVRSASEWTHNFSISLGAALHF